MSYKHELVEELKDEVIELGKIEVGSEKYKVGVDGVSKLTNAIAEIEKLENQKAENEVKYQQMEADNDIKIKQLEAEKKDRKMKNGIAIGSALMTTGIGVWAYISSMKYEANGIFPTTEGGKSVVRNLLNKIFK